MARRTSSQPPPVEIKVFTLPEIDLGIAKLRRRLAEVEGIDPRTVRYDDPRVDSVESNVRSSIREVFGPNSPEFRENEYHTLRVGPLRFNASNHELQQNLVNGIPAGKAMLENLIARLEEKRQDMKGAPSSSVTHPYSQGGRKVFVVHGHDEAAKESVARFLGTLHLEPIFLHEQPNKGRTVIEKLGANSDVAFAVVLLTPDDAGHASGQPDAARPRARQNVVMELGYFIGLLGREKVCPLVKGDLEKPSDYEGVVYVPMDAAGAWKLTLAREIKASGTSIDLNLAM
jgi:predicted nucleotide-binding protein